MDSEAPRGVKPVAAKPAGSRQHLLDTAAHLFSTIGFTESGMRQIFQPCLEMAGRLLGRSTDDPETVLRTLTLFGQVTIFCDKAVRRVLHLGEFTEERVRAIQGVVRAHTLAVFAAAAEGGALRI